MIPRGAAPTVKKLAKGFPVVAINGPRQSGKTTLARALFANHAYVSLEDPDEREFAAEDPRGFLGRFGHGVVLDEVQRAPHLFAYLQRVVDDDSRPGQWVLTGSQQFGLQAGITQSLAGRVGLVTLLPFDLAELRIARRIPAKLDSLLLQGGYPAVHDRNLDPATWYSSYVQTYLERDVRQLINVRDLTQFQRFLRLCAGRTAQLVNLSALGDDAGVSHNTVREWLSVLEASYVIHRLHPFHRNFNKRLVKTPKLHFVDAGLAAWLLGITDAAQLALNPLRGALFESWVVGEYLKAGYNAGRGGGLSFWRDRSGLEVDLLREVAEHTTAVEIKSGATVSADALRGLQRWREVAGKQAGVSVLVYGGSDTYRRDGVSVISWSALDPLSRGAT
ncbi:MAG: ATP-binding protein [Gammaproteobacteria bacterium]